MYGGPLKVTTRYQSTEMSKIRLNETGDRFPIYDTELSDERQNFERPITGFLKLLSVVERH